MNIVYMQKSHLQQVSRRGIYVTICKNLTSVILYMNIIYITQ